VSSCFVLKLCTNIKFSNQTTIMKSCLYDFEQHGWLLLYCSSFYTFQLFATSRFFTLKSLPLPFWSSGLLHDINF
jgi:hypothetical protein